MSASPPASPSAIPSSAVAYTGLVLRLYDFVVLQFSNAFAWRCSTRRVLLPLFKRHVGADAHMDIGVGSGYYLAASARQLADVAKLTLVDLNPDALQYAAERLKRAGHTRAVETVVHDVFQPFPADAHAQYDAVSLFYVFHCLPGKLPDKADAVFTRIKPVLKPDGLVYGATILPHNHNWVGSRLMRLYNAKGFFSNYDDSQAGLEAALHAHFAHVDEVKVVGKVALFVARKPIQDKT